MKAFDYTNAVRESNLPASPRWVYVALVLRYNHTKGSATWVSQETLAKDTGLSVSTVKRSLATLEASGWVHIDQRKGRTSLYAPSIGTNLVHHDLGHHDLGTHNLVHSDLGKQGNLGHHDLGVGHHELGGRSPRPTNREVSSETNREVEDTPAAPVATEEPTTSSLPSPGGKDGTHDSTSPSPEGQGPIENTDLGHHDLGMSETQRFKVQSLLKDRPEALKYYEDNEFKPGLGPVARATLAVQQAKQDWRNNQEGGQLSW